MTVESGSLFEGLCSHFNLGSPGLSAGPNRPPREGNHLVSDAEKSPLGKDDVEDSTIHIANDVGYGSNSLPEFAFF